MPDFPILGKYYAGSSIIHRLDPQTKLLVALLFMLAMFFVGDFIGLGICAVFIGLVYGISQVPASYALKALLPLLFIVVITMLINLFFIQGGEVLVQAGPLTISEQGVHTALFFGLRLVLILALITALTLTTSTLALTDAFEWLFGPLKAVKVPVHELGMMMGIALAFLPQFMHQLQWTYRSQAGRGAQFGAGGLGTRLNALGALIVPLFAGAFRQAETLSYAMEARCYHGGDDRTYLHPLRFSPRDAIATAITLAFALAALVV